MKQIQHKNVAFKASKVGDDGSFSGYASVFGNVDGGRDIVAPGAFAESIKRIKDGGDPLPILWQHRSGEPIGGSDVLEEDDHGLKTDGFILKELARGAEAHVLMKRRIVRGLSIGYYVEDSSYNEKEKVTTLKKLDLVEYSIVTFPMNTLAQIGDVKSASTIREFEAFLRDVGGFNLQQAKAIASRGWGAVSEARDAHEDSEEKSLAILQAFKLPTF